jgi:hypothetical protein
MAPLNPNVDLDYPSSPEAFSDITTPIIEILRTGVLPPSLVLRVLHTQTPNRLYLGDGIMMIQAMVSRELLRLFGELRTEAKVCLEQYSCIKVRRASDGVSIPYVL